MVSKYNIFNRELSWLSFNHRVLQEADDERNPLYERIKFLAIYSNNLDEFFRVRVASLRALLNLKDKSLNKLTFVPQELIKQIHSTVHKQQEFFGNIFRSKILPELQQNRIHLISNSDVDPQQGKFIKTYFEDNIIEHIQPLILIKNKISPFLKNNRLYLAIRLTNKTKKKEPPKRIRYQYALLEIPSNHLPRFVLLPERNGEHFIIFLDDIIRYCLPDIFKAYNIVDSYAIKLTRDAELYVEDEFTGDLLTKIEKGLKRRSTGVPARFLYDISIPKPFIKFLREAFQLRPEDMYEGSRYHNFNDFFDFPNPVGKHLEFETMPVLNHKKIDSYPDMYAAMESSDHLLHYPYQKFDYLLNFMKAAAKDPSVKTIKVTQYRVASNSQIVQSLIKAANNGKDVTVFVEIKARFDEESNISWAAEMQKAGIHVLYSFPGIKVHAKIALIQREINGEIKDYCYLSTGNFNEKTAKIYSDFGLFTTDKRITEEVEKVFFYLEGRIVNDKFKHLLVAQFNMRNKFDSLINNEIKFAKRGAPAKIILKLNSLEDRRMIGKLYEASNAGVEILILVRGICCLIPGEKNLSENIKAFSIVDRFLEHSRLYYFSNGGDDLIYLSSADWMKRNLSRRVEAAFPIYDPDIKRILLDIIAIHISDNTHNRIINKTQSNKYKKSPKGKEIRAQYEVYNYLKKIHG